MAHEFSEIPFLICVGDGSDGNRQNADEDSGHGEIENKKVLNCLQRPVGQRDVDHGCVADYSQKAYDRVDNSEEGYGGIAIGRVGVYMVVLLAASVYVPG